VLRELDALGYARFRHWRVYGEEALAGREAALRLASESLTVEHGGEPLSPYEVRVEPNTGELRSVARPSSRNTRALERHLLLHQLPVHGAVNGRRSLAVPLSPPTASP
jgi:hypothetical protein